MMSLPTTILDPHIPDSEPVTLRMPRTDEDDVSEIVGAWPFRDLPNELVLRYGALGYHLAMTSTGYAAIRVGLVLPHLDYAGDAADGVSFGWAWPLGETIQDLLVDDVVQAREWARTRVPIVLGDACDRLALARLSGPDVEIAVFGPGGWCRLEAACLGDADADRVDRVIEACTARASAVLHQVAPPA